MEKRGAYGWWYGICQEQRVVGVVQQLGNECLTDEAGGAGDDDEWVFGGHLGCLWDCVARSRICVEGAMFVFIYVQLPALAISMALDMTNFGWALRRE